jgi:hypothetical protein
MTARTPPLPPRKRGSRESRRAVLAVDAQRPAPWTPAFAGEAGENVGRRGLSSGKLSDTEVNEKGANPSSAARPERGDRARARWVG